PPVLAAKTRSRLQRSAGETVRRNDEQALSLVRASRRRLGEHVTCAVAETNDNLIGAGAARSVAVPVEAGAGDGIRERHRVLAPIEEHARQALVVAVVAETTPVVRVIDFDPPYRFDHAAARALRPESRDVARRANTTVRGDGDRCKRTCQQRSQRQPAFGP